ncbi:hypothetical protein COU61_03640 [Candidatus Pacearchaeota archaeon CG10_big_fil_rev_8_21_14_0_10_35_13]|nr:MAG: hypothetical protein COU61_03640 [Candidatus Pacearchaeota archaeon CG10_big_fil_rev_8_21_14_0_10_35_13]
MVKLSSKGELLVEKAFDSIKNVRVDKKILLSEVGSALFDNKGKLFTGVSLSITNSSAGSLCGEQAAIVKLLESGNDKIDTVVALWISKDYNQNKEWDVIPPCGSCRNVLSFFGNPRVIVSKKEKVRLKRLFPGPIFRH